jgi:hypothetical protein
LQETKLKEICLPTPLLNRNRLSPNNVSFYKQPYHNSDQYFVIRQWWPYQENSKYSTSLTYTVWHFHDTYTTLHIHIFSIWHHSLQTLLMFGLKPNQFMFCSYHSAIFTEIIKLFYYILSEYSFLLFKS